MTIPKELIIAGGLGQIFTALVYPYIRHKVFNWYEDVRKLKPLNQEIAKTYGRYIVGLNFSFGLIAILWPQDLQSHSNLALALSGLIGAYWIGKVITQFAYYPMYEIPKKKLFQYGSYFMNGLFGFFALLYGYLFSQNLIGQLSS